MKFLKADYLGESESNLNIKSQGKEMAQKLSELTDKEQKMKKEFEKIRRLDA